jgi:hypothetical protein
VGNLCWEDENEECYEYKGSCYVMCPTHVEISQETGKQTGRCATECSERQSVGEKLLCHLPNDPEPCYLFDGKVYLDFVLNFSFFFFLYIFFLYLVLDFSV